MKGTALQQPWLHRPDTQLHFRPRVFRDGSERPRGRHTASPKRRRLCKSAGEAVEVRPETSTPEVVDCVSHESASDNTHSNDKVASTFRWPAALFAREVQVSGSFMGWDTPIDLLRSDETGDFVRTLALLPGMYQYKYRVDGEWRTSPCEPITSDGQGFFNNQRLVSPSASFKWSSKWAGDEVFVTGDFSGWAELIPLQRNPVTRDFHLSCSLAPGTYSYQFLVDGTWMTSPDVPVSPDDDGHLCNKTTVEVLPAFHIFYATGWEDAFLRVRALNRDGTPDASEWREVPMYRTPSRAQPAGGAWMTAVIPAVGDPGGGGRQGLEFVCCGSAGQVDRPLGSESYMLRQPGGYKLQRGSLLPFPRARAAPTMLVSDLDGTMVGTSAWADEATAEFANYWESRAALSGGVLVYNTGRSLGQFVGLWEAKAGKLALPDALITAVGTKVFLLDAQRAGGRGRAGGAAWVEDAQWARRLDVGWDLQAARSAAAAALERHGGDDLAHWLDRGEEHPHRLALSVRADVLPRLQADLEQGLADKALLPNNLRAVLDGLEARQQARMIVSGTGGWRYLDCVAARGGKLEALEYVRTLFSVPRDRCVAAGDSGNDILMLDGKNPAIVVGNAQPELLAWLVAQEQSTRIVLAEAQMARGILEGLARLGLY